MASATRRRADSSIEHTVEGYQLGGAGGRASVSPDIHRLTTHACGKELWTADREIPREVFLPHSRWITFPLLTAVCLGLDQPSPQVCPQAAHNIAGVSAHLVHTVFHGVSWCRARRAGKMSEPSARTVSGNGIVRLRHVYWPAGPWAAEPWPAGLLARGGGGR